MLIESINLSVFYQCSRVMRALAAKGGEKEIKQKCPLNMRHAINAINEIVRFLAQSEMIDQKKKQRFSLSPLDVASFNYSS